MQDIKHTICDILIYQTNRSAKLNSIGDIQNKKVALMSFSQYKNTIEYLSLALSGLGLKSQKKVCILSNTRKEWNFFDLAIMCAGAVSVPIYPSYTEDEVQYIINHSDAEFLIVENELQFKKIIEIQNEISIKTIICIDYIELELKKKIKQEIEIVQYDDCLNIGVKQSQTNPDQFAHTIENISPDSLATIVYTSGTTGEPKGAMIKHKALFQVLYNVKKFTHSSINSSDRFLTYLPLSHVLGRLESFFPLIFGCEAVYTSDMKKLLEIIPLTKPTLLVAVPRVLEKIYEKAMKSIKANEIKHSVFKWANTAANNYFNCIAQDKTPKTTTIIQYQLAKKAVFEKVYNLFGGKIRYFISGGAPLSPTIIEFLRNCNLTVLEGYGLTETVAPCFLNPLNKQVPGTVGHPMGDVQVKFAFDGEILIKTEGLFCGYYKNEDATQEVLTDDGWFHTGDIGEFTSQGFLRITDRKKDIIITSGGKNVAPQKIENMLKLRPHISQCVIIGDQKKYLTALISIEKIELQKYFKEFEIDSECNIKDLSNHPSIISLVQKEIDAVNQDLASFETIKKFKIVPVEMGVDNYLTPSLKIKKKRVIEDFSQLVDSMYNSH